MRWDKYVNKFINDGVSYSQIGVTKYIPATSYTKTIEKTYRGYLHSLYRKATKLQGPKAGFGELAESMKKMSRIPSELRQELHLLLYFKPMVCSK